MRHRRAVIVAGTIALLSPMLTLHSRVYAQTEGPMATGKRDAASGTEAAAASSLKDKNFDPSTISKAIIDEASRLKNDAAGWSQKLQELDLDLKKNQQDVEATGKDIDECLVVLRAAANRLAPDAEARVALRKQEAGVRDLAIRAEVHSDPEIRKQAGFFQQKTTRTARAQPVGRGDTDAIGHADRPARGTEGPAGIQSGRRSDRRGGEGRRGQS